MARPFSDKVIDRHGVSEMNITQVRGHPGAPLNATLCGAAWSKRSGRLPYICSMVQRYVIVLS